MSDSSLAEGGEAHLRAFLSSRAMSVNPIPRRDRQRASEFRVLDGAAAYVVALREQEMIAAVLDFIARVESRRPAPTAPVAQLVANAAAALGQPGLAAPFELRVLWLSCLNHDAPLILELVKRRLFGLARVQVYAPHEGQRFLGTVHCFGYDFDDFSRLPNIDGVVLAAAEGHALCINMFSPRAEALRRSRLVSIFDFSVWDPLAMEREGRALILDRAVDRRDEAARHRALANKYRIEVKRLPEPELSRLIVLPAGDNPFSGGPPGPL